MDERREAPRVALRPEIEATVNDVPVRIVELSAVGTRIEHEQRFPLTSPELSVSWQGTSVKLAVRIVRSEIVGRTAAGLTYRTGMQFTGDRLLAESVVAAILGNSSQPATSVAPEPAPTVAAPPPVRIPFDGPPPVHIPFDGPSPVHIPFDGPSPVHIPFDGPSPVHIPFDGPAPAARVADSPPTPVAERPAPVVASPPPPPPPRPAAASSAAPPPSLDDTWTRQVRFLKKDPEDEMPYAQFRRSADGWKKSYVATPEQPSDGFTIRRDDRDFAELQRTFDCADPDTRRMMQIALQAKLEAELATKS